MRGKIIVAVLIVLVCVGVFFWIKTGYYDTYTVTGTVRSKYVEAVGEAGSRYKVTLTDGRVLIVDRSWFYISPETQQDRVFGSIEENKTYKFTCWGWHVEWFFIAWYPNVIKAEEIT